VRLARLNPLGRPFAYLYLDGKLTLYTTRACTDQLRARHGVRIEAVEAKAEDGLYIVLVRAALPDGRTDQDLGAVALEGLKGTARANAIMKAITKGKRRVTLSLLGLGLPDESEVDDLPQALRVDVDAATGEIQPPLRGLAMPETAAEFPTVATSGLEEERKQWLARINALHTERGDKAKLRADLWLTHCGGADPREVDPAALQVLYDALAKLPRAAAPQQQTL
jgi:hypothetical protein